MGVETTFSALRTNDWFKKTTTGRQVFIRGFGNNYCNIKHVYGGGRKAVKDFKVIKIAKILALILLLSSCTLHRHHDNDKCLYDNKMRYYKTK